MTDVTTRAPQPRELIRRMNDLPAHDGEHGFDGFNLLVGYREVIGRQGHQVRELTDGNGSLLAALGGKPAAALRVEPQRFLAAQAALIWIHRHAPDGFAGGEPVE